MVQAAGEVPACGGSLINQFIAPTPPSPRYIGETLRLKSTVTNGVADPWRVDKFEYKLDCANAGSFFLCTDEGAVMNFVGNVTTDCQDINNANITWAAVPAGNLVTFTPSQPVVLDAVGGAQTSCDINFDVQILSLSTDASPGAISGADNVDGVCFEAAEPGNSNLFLAGSAQGSTSTNVATCGITLKKEVSVDDGSTWADANSPSGPNLVLGENALYQLTVTNTGTADMSSVLVKDAALGIDPAVNVGPLAAGATKVVTSGDITKLNAIERCLVRGALENVSDAEGICRAGDPKVSATALDNAWVRCIGVPSIVLKKEISLTGADPWFDANEAGSAPTAVFPSDAYYRLTVTNNGTVPLENITVDDPTLGIDDVPVPGPLDPGQFVVLAQGEIPALFDEDRCTNSGTFLNTASTRGESVDTGEAVTDTDPAHLKCVGTPHISLRKQISVDGKAVDDVTKAWFDADAVGDLDVPQVTFPHGAQYRLIVKNDGTSPLINVQVADPELSISPTTIANLAVGEEVTVGSGDIAALSVATRCNSSGNFVNTASVSANSTETGEGVTASNPAVLVCVGVPNIDLLKEISLDGGLSWSDANTVGTAPPAVVFPHGAEYRITVTNIGSAPLKNVVVNDATLGIVDYEIGNMAAGAKVILTKVEITALNVATRCDRSGEFGNTASTSGQSAETNAPVSDSDPAFMVCVGTPDIDIEKQISVDNGTTWSDADTAGTAPSVVYPSGALYRFVVTNTGTAPLVNVTVQDAELGIGPTVIPGTLDPGDSVTIDSGTIPALAVVERCDEAGEFTNTAQVDADSAETEESVTDSDPAVLVCTGQDECLTRTPGFWGTHPHVTVQYLDISVCGKPIDTTRAGNNHSSAEAMCMSGVDAKNATPKSNMHYLQLVRQLTAAKLNVAASLEDGGTCDTVGGVNIDALIARCEARALCGDSGATGGSLITASGCIGLLDAFNNSEDTLDVFGPFVSPGPAAPAECQKATGNGVIVR